MALVLFGGSALAEGPLDARWAEQVLPLRRGTFEVGLGAGPSVIMTPIGTYVQPLADPSSTLRLGVFDWLEVSPAWIRARVTPASDGAGVLLGAGLEGVGVAGGTFPASTRAIFFPSLAVEGFLKRASVVAVLRLSLGMTFGISGGLAFTGGAHQTTSVTLLCRLTERWVMLSTLSLYVSGIGPGGELGAVPSMLVKSRSHLSPTWAIDLWINANSISITPGLSVVFAPSGLF